MVFVSMTDRLCQRRFDSARSIPFPAHSIDLSVALQYCAEFVGRFDEIFDFVESLIRSFLNSVAVRDGLGDTDVKLFEIYCRNQYPSSGLANLIAMQTARYLAGYGERNYTSSPLKLGYRVTALRLGVSYANWCPRRRFLGGHLRWRLLLDGDCQLAAASPSIETDDESYALLQSIVELNDDGNFDILKRIVSGPSRNSHSARAEGIVEVYN